MFLNLVRAFANLRPRGREGHGQALYCFVVDKHVMVMHAFIKKSRTTPRRDLDLARRRVKEVKDGQK
jgi:phage-related protein